MKFFSTIFLLFIVSTCVSAKTDILKLIEETDEGREVLDHVYLQTGISGNNFDVPIVSSRLKNLSRTAREIRRSFINAKKDNSKKCKKDLHSLNSRYQDFVLRTAATRSELANTFKQNNQNKLLIARGNEEIGNSRRFLGMSEAGSSAWNKFWVNLRRNYREISSLLARVRTHVSQLHRKNKDSALIEMPEDFNSALADITNEFDKNSDDLDGFRPIITNLLLIIKSPKHLRKREIRRSVRNILGRLAEKFQDSINTFAEENEHQKSLFSGLTSLYNDRVNRAKSTLKNLSNYSQVVNKKIRWLKQSIRGNSHLLNTAKEISDLKRAECRNINHMINTNSNKLTRIIQTSNQVLEVMSNRFGEFKNAVNKRGTKNK